MTNSTQPEEQSLDVGDDDAGERLDLFLVRHFPDHSRTALAKQIKDGNVDLVRGRPKKARPGLRLEPGDRVTVRLEPPPPGHAIPEPIDLELVHEDERLLVVNKRAGLTVHPGVGQRSGTLANALAYHFERLSAVSGPMRPGIVHRLDKDTSGVLLVAKDDAAHTFLAEQFRLREVKKEYLAVVRGSPDLDADLIDRPIGVHKRDPVRRAVRLDVGKQAQTHWEVVERFRAHALLRCRPRSGRTHQIRVHLASVRHPIVSDRLYGGVDPVFSEVCPRQALHAHRLTFRHPETAADLTVEAPVPADIEALLARLRG